MSTDVRATGKSRSQRINIDYYRQQTWLTRSRGLLALVAAFSAAVYCFYVYSSGGARHLSTGPVAAAHASFENDCKQCHFDFMPISGDALQLASSSALTRLETACQKCHRADHHFRGSMNPEFAAIDQHCSGCHTDHLGRDNDMVNIASEKCTQCHADLPAACIAGSAPQIRQSISEFTLEGHGTFASLTKGDPGRIKFDHAQHMLPGQVDANVKGAFQISMLEPNLRDRYRKLVEGGKQADDALVTLSCNDCHQFAGVPGDSFVGDDDVGRHIEPILFDKHCAACHCMNAAGRAEGTLPFPHAAPWKELELLIASKVVGGQQLGSIRMPRDLTRKTPLLGEGFGGGQLNSSNEQDQLLSMEAAVKAGRAAIQQRCLQCHDANDISDETITALRSDKIAPLIPDRWFTKGIYDHAAHRKVDCKLCHAAAYPNASATEKIDNAEVVMIGGIETCTGCHRPAESEVPSSVVSQKELLNNQTTWASDACIECHRYHWERPQPDAVETKTPEVALAEVKQ